MICTTLDLLSVSAVCFAASGRLSSPPGGATGHSGSLPGAGRRSIRASRFAGVRALPPNGASPAAVAACEASDEQIGELPSARLPARDGRNRDRAGWSLCIRVDRDVDKGTLSRVQRRLKRKRNMTACTRID